MSIGEVRWAIPTLRDLNQTSAPPESLAYVQHQRGPDCTDDWKVGASAPLAKRRREVRRIDAQKGQMLTASAPSIYQRG